MLPTRLAFVDVETTGLSVTHDKIIEIGIVRVENGKVVKKFQTLLNPGYSFPQEITQITGITPQEVASAPTFREMKKEILAMLTDCVFVAHNVRFDYSFIKNAFKREEQTITLKHFCTVRLSHLLFPQERSHSLDSIINRFSIPVKKRHRAFDDAFVLWEFYSQLQKHIPEKLFESAINMALKRPYLPSSLPMETIDALPELPGVYIFYAKDGMPLYIGKSINIKERVLSHFSDYESQKEMHIAQQVVSIETHVTSGELGALLKEATLIKNMQPMYNRKLRQNKKVVLLKKRINTDGFSEIIPETTDAIDPFALEDIVGVFRSSRQAKDFLIEKAKKYHLCEKLLSLEKTKSGCFAYRLGVCKGACVGEEKSMVYNVRCIEAFGNDSMKQWPFDTPIAILEKDNLEKTEEYFVLDKWCIIGDFIRQDDNQLQGRNYEYLFDTDTYKILLSYFSKKSNWKNLYKMPTKDSLVPFLHAE